MTLSMIINTRKIYVYVIYISDLYDPNGININKNLLIEIKGQFSQFKFMSSYQSNPSHYVRIIWNKAIQRVFGIQ